MNTGSSLPALLVVDDDPLIRDSLRLALADSFDITLAENRTQAVMLLRDMDAPPALALVDLGLPPTPHRPEEGFRLIAALLTHAPDIKIIALSGQDEESNARHARALGAVDFIAKPCAPAIIKAQLNNALLIPSTEAESRDDQQLGIIGQSTPIQAMRSQIMLYASTPYPVLIEGESGSGKELVAAALQRLSPNSKAPFIVFNCAAISPQLVEAALFGHTKGAYTGASQAQNGFFEDAADGILFLDEIGELPLELQAKLLRVLENGEFQRVGETTTRKSRARIIAATNRDLRQAVRDGQFRLDLYHRLSVFTIHVPPLRELGADKLLQLLHFRDFYAAQIQRPPFQLSDAALELWASYSFPGNTRELRNIAIRLATKHPGQTITPAQLEAELDLPDSNAPSQPGDAVAQARQVLQQDAAFNLDDLLMHYTSQYIDAAMELSHGNVSEAAKLLGLNRTTLYSRMDALQKYKLNKTREGIH
ncbi:MAG TPA: sigma-54 dependent transcriptional regulator [Gallionellaceae bacterium]|nr:sigma-54 dependent transcriptional regulator [Gallionellaceae bacterium]